MNGVCVINALDLITVIPPCIRNHQEVNKAMMEALASAVLNLRNKSKYHHIITLFPAKGLRKVRHRNVPRNGKRLSSLLWECIQSVKRGRLYMSLLFLVGPLDSPSFQACQPVDRSVERSGLVCALGFSSGGKGVVITLASIPVPSFFSKLLCHQYSCYHISHFAQLFVFIFQQPELWSRRKRGGQ